MRRVIAALALLALVSAPVVGRSRLFCRFSGVEITGCAEQEAETPEGPVVQVEGCCDRQVTRPLGVTVSLQQWEVSPPALQALPGLSSPDAPPLVPPAPVAPFAAPPSGPPVFLITRALLL